MWEKCGMARNEKGLERAARADSRHSRGVLEERHRAGQQRQILNVSLEKAGRVADFFEFGELLVIATPSTVTSRAAATSAKSTRTKRASAKRNDEKYMHVSVWEHQGEGRAPVRHKEPLSFEYVKPAKRSYK